MPRIQQLWVDLSIAMNNVPKGESIIERRTAPWDSDDEEISKAWESLTKPVNLSLLLEWGADDLNLEARKATDKAIECCRKRAQSTTNKSAQRNT